MIRLLWLGLIATVAAAFALDLSGEWRFHTGDDPHWAAPEFDDHAWRRTELPLPARSVGSFWLRRTVVLGESIEDPAISFGTFAWRYQVYFNGQLVAASQPRWSSAYFWPRVFALQGGSLRTGSRLCIAVRVEGQTSQLAQLASLRDDGPYLLTERRQAEDAVRLQILTHRQALMLTLLAGYTQLIFAALLLLFWLTGARRTELLWFACFLAGAAVYNTLALGSAYWELDRAWLVFSVSIAFVCLSRALGILFGERHVWTWTLTAASLLIVGSLVGARSWIAAVPLIPATVWALRGLIQGGRDRRKLAVPVLVYVAFNFNNVALAYLSFSWWPIPSGFYAGGSLVYFASWISAAFGITVGLAMIWSVAAERRDQERLSGELQAARHVQQMLLTPPRSSGAYTIDAAYEPAAEVGGDFYVTLPGTAGYESTVVVGDVSGKGLKAAMVVSLLTGALRNRRAQDPAALLHELNQVMVEGFEGGFVTVAIARFSSDGRFSVASAGHPAPLLNGEELSVTASLPIGIERDTEYVEFAGVIPVGSQLTFVSDGVIEAARDGELFGFDRTLAISTQSAAEIAAAAKAWGQNDDITVVTVRRLA